MRVSVWPGLRLCEAPVMRHRGIEDSAPATRKPARACGSGLAGGLDLFLEAGQDPAAGAVHGGDSEAQLPRHLLAGPAIDRCPPERLPGDVADLAADQLAGPGEEALLPLDVP